MYDPTLIDRPGHAWTSWACLYKCLNICTLCVFSNCVHTTCMFVFVCMTLYHPLFMTKSYLPCPAGAWYVYMCTYAYAYTYAYLCVQVCQSSARAKVTYIYECVMVCVYIHMVCVYIHIHVFTHTSANTNAPECTYTSACIYMLGPRSAQRRTYLRLETNSFPRPSLLDMSLSQQIFWCPADRTAFMIKSVRHTYMHAHILT